MEELFPPTDHTAYPDYFWLKPSYKGHKCPALYLIGQPVVSKFPEVTKILCDSQTELMARECSGLFWEDLENIYKDHDIKLVLVDIKQQPSTPIQFAPLSEDLQHELGLSNGNPTPDEIYAACISSSDRLAYYPLLMARHLVALCIAHDCQGFVTHTGELYIFKE